jgi:1,4-alpha-glucan branching enzyme
MGWMNDTLQYFSKDPVYRRHEHNKITFSFMYAWTENFILPISHDEVVHGKRSLLDKMPGDEWQKRANYRLFMTYMTAHPGKKLMFMGSEFGQWHEWRDHEQLDWPLLQDPKHQALRDLNRELARFYRNHPQFHASDCEAYGFRWSDLHNADESVFAFLRQEEGHAPIVCVFNATPVAREDYWIGVPDPWPTTKWSSIRISAPSAARASRCRALRGVRARRARLSVRAAHPVAAARRRCS